MKLLIVDDEVRTREFLHHRIPWDTLGLDEVESAKNGFAALERVGEWHPDIILCDIRMPKMDGIEFAKRLRQTDLDAKLIFLSGFSDKEYLFSAIQLQAFQFIEKPIRPDVLMDAVGQAVRAQQAEAAKKAEEIRLQSAYDANIPILRREMVRKLITDPSSPHVLPALGNRGTFLLPVEGPYTVAVAPVFWNPVLYAKDVKTVQDELLERLGNDPTAREWNMIGGFDSQSWLVLIMPGKFGSSYGEGKQRLDRLHGMLQRYLDSRIAFKLGVGNAARHLAEIPESYRSAFEAGNLEFYKERGGITFASELGGHEPLETDWEELKQFREAIRKGDVVQATRHVHDLSARARKCRDLDIIRVKDVYFQFLLILLEVALQQGLTDNDEAGESRYIWKEIDRIPDLKGLENYVLSFLAPFLREEGESRAGSGKLREIIRYIHAHFHDRNFAIQAIADHVNLSETYLCSFFKKQRGQTIKEYITATRVEKAKELLADQERKLYEIALSVGIGDANYFTTFFKKYAGCTPSEYRERLGR
ncbi:response regulator [Cohnella cholangitidis]|uniref:Response regulator n=1 Tax=Cohnella cholangitidis TaxID=2598458 RepID=A0A7G5BVK6_9BACL|nr:response regulator [Cohnella cholangitidis]QMV40990.1 response regulator [Cohnella cholangitidis]